MTKGESCLAVKYHLNLKRRKTVNFSMGGSISKAFRLLTATGIFKYLRKLKVLTETLNNQESNFNEANLREHKEGGKSPTEWIFCFRRTIVIVKVIC